MPWRQSEDFSDDVVATETGSECVCELYNITRTKTVLTTMMRTLILEIIRQFLRPRRGYAKSCKN
ncbi:hypothetical protein CGZ80_07715 [Rhodopirellula sp. MGV]|nr:hypothetical protein CGZ80_07715 [Rhodopirellula sp. MGV]PNY36092.1 hypothetical protein C2E31_14665 [Rhodopirellula baltica]PNY36116.1 hypothetical protein C2E31_14800 [Rhodopirellula baltica]